MVTHLQTHGWSHQPQEALSKHHRTTEQYCFKFISLFTTIKSGSSLSLQKTLQGQPYA